MIVSPIQEYVNDIDRKLVMMKVRMIEAVRMVLLEILFHQAGSLRIIKWLPLAQTRGNKAL